MELICLRIWTVNPRNPSSFQKEKWKKCCMWDGTDYRSWRNWLSRGLQLNYRIIGTLLRIATLKKCAFCFELLVNFQFYCLMLPLGAMGSALSGPVHTSTQYPNFLIWSPGLPELFTMYQDSHKLPVLFPVRIRVSPVVHDIRVHYVTLTYSIYSCKSVTSH